MCVTSCPPFCVPVDTKVAAGFPDMDCFIQCAPVMSKKAFLAETGDMAG